MPYILFLVFNFPSGSEFCEKTLKFTALHPIALLHQNLSVQIIAFFESAHFQVPIFPLGATAFVLCRLQYSQMFCVYLLVHHGSFTVMLNYYILGGNSGILGYITVMTKL